MAKNIKISIGITERELIELMEGTVYNWHYPDENGSKQTVDVELSRKDDE